MPKTPTSWWIVALYCSLLLSCSKLNLMDGEVPPPPVASLSAAGDMLALALPRLGLNASGTTATGVQSYQAAGISISLVTYVDASNMVQTVAFKTSAGTNGEWETLAFRCTGSCNCLIEVYETTDGGIDLRCSCSPCSIVNE